MTAFAIAPNKVEELLALPTRSDQETWLAGENLLDTEGLHHLLDYADVAARTSPAQADEITQLCQDVATSLNADTVSPRAKYLQAQTLSLRGNAQDALSLIETARDEYSQLGMTVDALRTEVGLLHAYTMLGDYARAVDAGQRALDKIDARLLDTSNDSASNDSASNDSASNDSASDNNASDNDTAALQLIQAKLLLNLGPPLSESGRFEETLASYVRAEALFASLQQTDDLVYVLNNRGVTLRYLGRVDEALAAYQNALAAYQSVLAESQQASGYFYALLQTNIGDAHQLLGDFTASLAAYDLARREFVAQGLDADEQICKSHMAEAYLALNLFPEALKLFQEAADALFDTSFHYHRGKALWGMGVAYGAQGELEQSGDCLQQAADIFARQDNMPLLAAVQLEQAALHESQGDHASAIATVAQVLRQLGQDETNAWPVQQVYAHLRTVDLLLPAVDHAQQHLERAESIVATLSLPHLRYRLLQRQAHLLRLQGRSDEAIRLLERAIEIIEQLRSTLASETFRISFQQDKMSVYELLIELHLERPYSPEALVQTFTLIEQAKSRALVERLSGTVGEFIDRNEDEPADRVAQIQTRLNAIYNELLGQESGDPDDPEPRHGRAARAERLSHQAAILESELTQLRLESPIDEPVRIRAHFLPTDDIQRQLSRGMVIVSYHTVGDEILAFLISRESIQLVRQIGSLGQLQQQLARLRLHWQHFQAQPQFVERHLPRLEMQAEQILNLLYQTAFEPLDMLITDATSAEEGRPRQVVIVPHGLLHQVPFHALHDGEQYLVDGYELSYAPNATIYTICQQRQMRASDTVTAFAVADEAIPAVEAEVSAIRRALPQSNTWLDDAADLAAFSSHTAESRILHLACHGLYRMDNPAYSALKLYDGWLTAVQLSQTDLRGTLVILSACESGRGTVLAGDEMIGLTRACLSAGANGLIVSQWIVQDDTGAMLMAEWYARIAQGQSASAALRGAQVSLKSSHPHPYYWAPFTLIGRRGKLFL